MGAFTVLNGNASFKQAKQWWPQGDAKRWDDAVKFLEKNRKFLKEWRDDVAGHFLANAAAFAIDNIQPEAAGLFEVFLRGKGADIRMKFAYDLVAVALVKNRDASVPLEEFLKNAFTFLLDATKQVINAVSVATYYQVLPRLK